MKKFAFNAVAIAAGALAASGALAGSITSPANDGAATVYAVEALVNTTDITAPPITYTMGVARTAAQDFTIIYKPSAGAAFLSCPVAPGAFALGGAGAVTVSNKRSSATECAYEVDVTTATDTTTTLTLTGLTFTSHTLGTAGNNASVSVGLWDLGETARIDNNSDLSRRVAVSAQAVNIYASALDANTVADVNAVNGPLTGFLVTGGPIADSATQANALLTMDNNSINAKNPDGTTNFDFTATTGTASITLTGSTSGAATNGFCWDLSFGGACGSGEIFTLTANTATLSGIPSSQFPAAGSTDVRPVRFNANGTTQLGTSRSFALSGTITPQVGAAEALANTNGVNGAWWTWSANASQLMSPYFSTNPQYVTRFFLLNTGALPVGYTATCFSEGGGTVTNGAAISGTLAANSNNNIDAAAICSFSNAPRGAILFTINAPIDTVKGTYNIVDKVTGANGFVPLTRPYNVANTTE